MSARCELLKIIKLLRAREITIDKFESQSFNLISGLKQERDPDYVLIKDVFNQIWQLYDDLSDDYLTVDDGIDKDLDRYSCFLTSDLEYEWPELSGGGIWNLFTFGYFNKLKRQRLRKFGDLKFWPFKTMSDYESQCKEKGVE